MALARYLDDVTTACFGLPLSLAVAMIDGKAEHWRQTGPIRSSAPGWHPYHCTYT